MEICPNSAVEPSCARGFYSAIDFWFTDSIFCFPKRSRGPPSPFLARKTIVGRVEFRGLASFSDLPKLGHRAAHNDIALWYCSSSLRFNEKICPNSIAILPCMDRSPIIDEIGQGCGIPRAFHRQGVCMRLTHPDGWHLYRIEEVLRPKMMSLLRALAASPL